MELRRVIGRDNRSATAQAIAQYGPDALIVSSERVNGKVEVIVAVDLEPAEEAAAMPVSVEADLRSEKTVAAPPVPLPAPAKPGAASFDSVLTDKLVTVVRPPAAVFPAAPAVDGPLEAQRARELVTMVREEIAGIREEFRLASKQGMAMWNLGLKPLLIPLANAMGEAGVPTALRSLLLDQIRDAEDDAAALELLGNTLSHATRRQAAAGPLAGIHVIAGPSGAGKSLMIGRLAATHARAKAYGTEAVAVVSFCDHRAGAWSQIQMIAAQAGVDCFRAGNEEVLRALLPELATRRLILIDTPGIQMKEHLGRIAANVPNAQYHLLLPAESSGATFKRHLEATGIAWRSLMLSKIDEALHPWALFQALIDHRIPVSFAGMGASAPLARVETDGLVRAAVRNLAEALRQADQR